MSSENGKTIFEEAAAERELEELRLAIEETRARRRRANTAFDEFLEGFDKRNRAPVPAPQPAGPPPRQQDVRAEAPNEMPRGDGLSAVGPAAAPAPAASAVPPRPVELSALDDFALEEPFTDLAPLRSIPAALASARSSAVRRAAPLVGIAVVGLLAVFLWSRPRSQDDAAPPVAVAAPPAPAVPAPAPPAAATSEIPPAEVTTIRRVWMRVTVDGERVVEREVAEGTKIPLNGSQIVIRAGDAGAVRVSIAGKDQGVFGPAGQAATRTLTVKP
jgi:hypothetical protein